MQKNFERNWEKSFPDLPKLTQKAYTFFLIATPLCFYDFAIYNAFVF